MKNENFARSVEVITAKLEGGYFSPGMFNDGRLSPKFRGIYGASGETMFGIDRVNGAGLSKISPGAWREFWATIDAANKVKKWPYNYRGGASEQKLKQLATEIMRPHYESLEKKYLKPKTVEAVNASPLLALHMVYGSWNGAKWFQRFAGVLNDSVAKGDSTEQTIGKAVNSRLNSGNTIIKRTGEKIGAMAGGKFPVIKTSISFGIVLLLIFIVWRLN